MDQCTQSVYTQMNLGQPSSKGFSFPCLEWPQKLELVLPSKRDYKKKQASLSRSAHMLEHREDSTGMRREVTSFMISLFAGDFGAAGCLSRTAFQELPAGMPMQRSHALHRAICALTHIHKASELTAGKVLPQQQDKQGVEITLMQSPCEDQPLQFTMVAR